MLVRHAGVAAAAPTTHVTLILNSWRELGTYIPDRCLALTDLKKKIEACQSCHCFEILWLRNTGRSNGGSMGVGRAQVLFDVRYTSCDLRSLRLERVAASL